jgi:hypothetical protein
VQPLVGVQAVLVGESLAALGAAVRTQPCVHLEEQTFILLLENTFIT